MPYVIVRTFSAGAFAGYLERRDGKETVLSHARRLWYWEGAASLSELAVRGTSKPDRCLFPTPVPQITLPETVEIIECTPEGQRSIEEVEEWTAHS